MKKVTLIILLCYSCFTNSMEVGSEESEEQQPTIEQRIAEVQVTQKLAEWRAFEDLQQPLLKSPDGKHAKKLVEVLKHLAEEKMLYKLVAGKLYTREAIREEVKPIVEEVFKENIPILAEAIAECLQTYQTPLATSKKKKNKKDKKISLRSSLPKLTETIKRKKRKGKGKKKTRASD